MAGSGLSAQGLLMAQYLGGHLAGIVSDTVVLVCEGAQHGRHDLGQVLVVLVGQAVGEADSGGGEAQQPALPAVGLQCGSHVTPLPLWQEVPELKARSGVFAAAPA